MGITTLENGRCAILPFRRAPQGLRPGRPAVELHPGHVVFFTGIRYSREDEAELGGPQRDPDGGEGDGSVSSGPGGKRRRRA